MYGMLDVEATPEVSELEVEVAVFARRVVVVGVEGVLAHEATNGTTRNSPTAAMSPRLLPETNMEHAPTKTSYAPQPLDEGNSTPVPHCPQQGSTVR